MLSKNNKLQAAPTEKKKWWNKKRIIAVSVISVALVAAIAVISVMIANAVRPIPSSKEDARVVGTVGDYEVKYEELRYLTLMHRESLDGEIGVYETLPESLKAEYESLLRERVNADIKKNYAILALCAEYGIDTDSSDVRKEVKKGMKTYVQDNFSGSMAEYKAWLNDNGLTDSIIRFNYKINVLENKLLNHFVENGIDIEYDGRNVTEFVDYVMEGEDWARTVHVFYPKTHPYTSAESREAFVSSQLTQGSLSNAEFKDMKDAWSNQLLEQAEKYNDKGAKSYAKETAELLSAAYSDEERYAAIKKEIGKAPYVGGFSMDSSVSGIYFTYGQMGDKYESAVFALDVYATSEVIESEDGYYVIMRLPLEEDDVKKQVDTLLVQYQYAALKKHIDSKRESLYFTGNDYFNSLNLLEIK